MVGVYAALKMTGETQSKLVLLLGNKMTTVVDPGGVPWDQAVRLEQTSLYLTFANLVFFVGLICALGHFVFTFRRTPALRAVSRVGIVTLMVTFGSMFGFTVLGRIALLIERVSDLDGYTAPEYSLAGGGLLSAVLSPPILLGSLITLVLLVGRRGGPPSESRA
jgi:nitrate reductase gamma subunit